MNTEQTIELFKIIKVSYPQYKVDDLRLSINVWNKMLEDYDYKDVQNGLMAFIKTDTKGFPPSIGQLIDCIVKTSTEPNMNEMEAWNMVRKAICDSTYHSQERFDEFPEEVQRAVGSPSQLRAWAMDMGYNEGVAQSNFIKVYKSVLEQKNNRLKFDANVSKLALKGNQNIGIECNGKT